MTRPGEAAGPAQPSSVVKRSMMVAGHATSISLEDAFWSGLKDIARARGRSTAALVADIDGGRNNANLSSAIRVFVLQALRQASSAHSED